MDLGSCAACERGDASGAMRPVLSKVLGLLMAAVAPSTQGGRGSSLMVVTSWLRREL